MKEFVPKQISKRSDLDKLLAANAEVNDLKSTGLDITCAWCEKKMLRETCVRVSFQKVFRVSDPNCAWHDAYVHSKKCWDELTKVISDRVVIFPHGKVLVAKGK